MAISTLTPATGCVKYSKPPAGADKRQDLALRACQVKMCVDLNIKAIKTKQNNEIALWYCLRSLDSKHNGELELGEAIEGLKVVFHYSPNTLAKHLNLGEGKLWRRVIGKYRTRILIYGLFAAHRYFDIKRKTDNHPRLIEVSQFNGVLKRDAWLYAIIYNPEGIEANPISRQTLTELTGLSRTQQRRYEKAAGVKRTPNYAMIADRNDKGHIVSVKPDRMLVSNKDTQYFVNKRAPNIYHCKASIGVKGMLGNLKLTRRYKGESYLTGEISMMKRWFRSMRQYVRVALKWKSGGVFEPSLILLPNRLRLIKGRLEWYYA